MKWPKVLIVTPIYEAKDYCLDKFLEVMSELDYPNYDHIIVDNSKDQKYWRSIKGKCKKRGIEVFHVRRGNSSREALCRAQNFARKKLLEGDYEYMFSVESDIFPPKEALKRLMLSGEQLISGAYLIGHGNLKVPCITLFDYKEELRVLGTRLIGVKKKEDGTEYFDQDEVDRYCRPGVYEVASSGVGCALIHREILEKVKFMYEPGLRGHSDIYFYNDCHRQGYRAYVDTHIWCYHDNSDWTQVEDR